MLGLVLSEIRTNENRSRNVRCGTVLVLVDCTAVFHRVVAAAGVDGSTCMLSLASYTPYVAYVHEAKYHIYHEGDGARVGGEATRVGERHGKGNHIHIMSVIFLFPFTYMSFARFQLRGSGSVLRPPCRTASGIDVQRPQSLS